MGRRLIFRRIAALTLRPYAVLAWLSPCYSPPEGRLPTCYAPVRRWYCYPLDLHVLGHPLAFALSQDQTLQFFRLDCRSLYFSQADALFATPLSRRVDADRRLKGSSTGPFTVCFSKTAAGPFFGRNRPVCPWIFATRRRLGHTRPPPQRHSRRPPPSMTSRLPRQP